MLSFISDLLGLGQQQHNAGGGALGLFLGGYSVPAAAAATYGGMDMIQSQRWAEAEIRGYVASLEREIEELQRALDDCARG